MNINPGKTQFTDAEHASLRDQVRSKMAGLGIAQAEVGRQADVPGSTLSQYLSGTYTSEPGRTETATALTRWLKSIAVAEDYGRQKPKTPAYLPLVGAQKITAILQYARLTGDLVMIAGAPGVSKTSAARQFQSDNPRTWYAPMDSTITGAPTMLLEILAAMGHPDVKGPPNTLMRRICELAAEATGLLIIDEAQHLSDKGIEALRAINDRVGLGIAILGNEGAYAQVGVAGGKAAFAQVSSRFGHREYIVRPDPADAAQLAHAFANENGEEIGQREVAFCQEIAARAGGLRNVEKTFRKALLAARGAREPFDLSHLQGAYAQLSGQAGR
ncbi:MAG: AAA family ATPase [Phenylobacterium sp.]|nr:AAA family ATPase [Phenylobacterium sp.]